ncbi:hypothetical protein QUB09_34000 [Microcoleus sp. C2C6]|uniref:hypothetical protein n=1 Tax=Microcoleus sp. C2C6 TaxID=3055325 RepID=UPI002FD4EB34
MSIDLATHNKCVAFIRKAFATADRSRICSPALQQSSRKSAKTDMLIVLQSGTNLHHRPQTAYRARMASVSANSAQKI